MLNSSVWLLLSLKNVFQSFGTMICFWQSSTSPRIYPVLILPPPSFHLHSYLSINTYQKQFNSYIICADIVTLWNYALACLLLDCVQCSWLKCFDMFLLGSRWPSGVGGGCLCHIYEMMIQGSSVQFRIDTFQFI